MTEISRGFCLLPERMAPLEAKLYQQIRTLHCDRNRQSHACCGRVTLDAGGMTLQCPLCGDHRALYPTGGDAADV